MPTDFQLLSFHWRFFLSVVSQLLSLCLPVVPNHYVSTHLFRHALSTPLATTRLNLELALATPSDARTSYLETALHSTNHVCQLFQMLPPANQPCQQHFLVGPALQELKQMLHLTYPQVQFWFDPVQLSRIKINGCQWYFHEMLLCLVTNAFQAYGDTTGLKTVIVSCQIRFSELELTIIDGGKGMNWLVKQLACRPGFSLREQPSTHQGLGLALTKLLITHHFLGKLTIHSQPGRGTTISIRLPQATGGNTRTHDESAGIQQRDPTPNAIGGYRRQ